jgi:hypothetical protein
MKTKFSTMTPEQISYQRSDIKNPLRSKGFFTEYNSFQEFASEFDWKSKQFDDGHSDRRKAGITTVGSWERFLDWRIQTGCPTAHCRRLYGVGSRCRSYASGNQFQGVPKGTPGILDFSP